MNASGRPCTAPLSPRFVVTGRGLVSAIGIDLAAFRSHLLQGSGGIERHAGLVPGQAVFAGIVPPFSPHPALLDADRNAQLAGCAVQQALVEAGLSGDDGRLRRGDRVALLMGTSHGGRSQLDRFVESGAGLVGEPLTAHTARSVLEQAAHHHQTARVARAFGIGGPVQTFSTACSSSGTAVAHGLELLRRGQVDAVIAGGADAFSKLTWAGFRALGAIADGPCGPFGETVGMTLGEGAAFLVIEREDDPRGAHDALDANDARPGGAVRRPLGWLHACASSWDAHHLTAPDPGGRGMARAIADALALAGLPAAAIDYVNAHATGTRANDISETLALKASFAGRRVPPISATKSFTGHTLGASSVLGYLAALCATETGHLPPTLNHPGPRPGCDLDCVPQHARPAPVRHFLAESAAFGGANCVLAGGAADAPAPPQALQPDDIVLTGLGVISPLGCGATAFIEALADQAEAEAAPCAPRAEAQLPGPGSVPLRPVLGFEPRRDLPPGAPPRMDRISQYAVGAAQQALQQAGWGTQRARPAGIGLMVALCRGAAASFEAYLRSVHTTTSHDPQGDPHAPPRPDAQGSRHADSQDAPGPDWTRASALHFPSLVMSSVGGKASMALALKGPASTAVGSDEVGLSLLAHAADLLRARADLDAIVVVAADETTPLYQRLEAARRGGVAGLPLAEGAAAVLLERRAKALARGARPLARLGGAAQTFGAPQRALAQAAAGHPAPEWTLCTSARDLVGIDTAADADTSVRTPVLTDTGADLAAIAGASANVGAHTGALPGLTGHAEASGGLWGVVAATLALNDPALAARALQQRRPTSAAGTGALLYAIGETGACAAVLLHPVAAGDEQP